MELLLAITNFLRAAVSGSLKGREPRNSSLQVWPLLPRPPHL